MAGFPHRGLKTLEPEYKAWYNKGWRYSASSNASLDHPNANIVAWEDGYLDYAAGREKWHLAFCERNGGCSEHQYQCPAVCEANGRRCQADASHEGLHDFIGVPHPTPAPQAPVSPPELPPSVQRAARLIGLAPPKNPHSTKAEDRRWHIVETLSPSFVSFTQVYGPSSIDAEGAQLEANRILGHEYTWAPKGHGFHANLEGES